MLLIFARDFWTLDTFFEFCIMINPFSFNIKKLYSTVWPEGGHAGLHLAEGQTLKNMFQIPVSLWRWMPAGPVFDSQSVSVCECESLIKTSPDLAVTPSLGELFARQYSNIPLKL